MLLLLLVVFEWLATLKRARKGVQNLKNVIEKEKRMQRSGNMGVNFLFIG